MSDPRLDVVLMKAYTEQIDQARPTRAEAHEQGAKKPPNP